MIPYINTATLNNNPESFSLDITYTVYNSGKARITLESELSQIFVKTSKGYEHKGVICEQDESSNKEVTRSITFELGTNSDNIDNIPVDFTIEITDGAGEKHATERTVDLEQSDLTKID